MFELNTKVKVINNCFDQNHWAEWIQKNAPEYARCRLASALKPGVAHVICASGPHWDNNDETLYLVKGAKKRSCFVMVVSEQDITPVDNIITKKEKKIMNTKSENHIQSVNHRESFAKAVKIITEAAQRAGAEKADELTLEQIIKRVNEVIERGDIVRLVNPVKAVTDGDSLFIGAFEKFVKYYPYMIFPRKNITGEVIEIFNEKIEPVYAIADYKGRVWLMQREGLDIVKGV